jgi:site-specific recombinase XerD
LSELEFISRERYDQFSADHIAQSLTVLIKEYQLNKKSEKLLNLVWSLFHYLCSESEKKKNNKKKIVLNKKGPLILGKIKLSEL